MKNILILAKAGLALAYNFGSWYLRPLSNIDTSKTFNISAAQGTPENEKEILRQ